MVQAAPRPLPQLPNLPLLRVLEGRIARQGMILPALGLGGNVKADGGFHTPKKVKRFLQKWRVGEGFGGGGSLWLEQLMIRLVSRSYGIIDLLHKTVLGDFFKKNLCF